MPDDFERLAFFNGFWRGFFVNKAITNAMVKGNNRLRDTIIYQFVAKMFRWRDDEIGGISVIYHQRPHFSASDGWREIIVF